MSDNALTRRSFLKRSAAGAAVVAGGGFVGFSAWEQGQQARAAGTKKAVHSLCNSCSSKCGFTAYVGEDGRFTEMVGDKDHPYCDGTLCARGYGYASIAWSEDRLTDPLKKNDAGEFEAISWDQAYAEIAEKVQSIISSDGPQALAMIQDPRPSGSFYTKRFMNALGSANVYTHGVACNMSKNSGMTQASVPPTSRRTSPTPRWSCSWAAPMPTASAPPRCTRCRRATPRARASSWSTRAITTPCTSATSGCRFVRGTDLALILGMAHVLVTQGTYDTAYVEQYTVGFEDWAARLAEYTPEVGRREDRHPGRDHRAPRQRDVGGRSAVLHRAGLARRLRLRTPELRRDRPRAVPVQHAARLLGP